MFKFKKVFFAIATFVFMALISLSTVQFEAKKIIIEEDDNPDGVTDFVLGNREYFIEINEETGIGFVIYSSNNNDYVLGTCSVTVIDENQNEYIECNSSANFEVLGEITLIKLSDDNEFYISSLTGEVSNIFTLNDVVRIVE